MEISYDKMDNTNIILNYLHQLRYNDYHKFAIGNTEKLQTFISEHQIESDNDLIKLKIDDIICYFNFVIPDYVFYFKNKDDKLKFELLF